jgi:hypothetical protein
MTTDASELIALCEEILADGEVTVDEVSRLGAWLGAREHVRRTWPGDVLAPPIQDVLLDGKVNKGELRKIASLLRRIHKEWVKREEELVHQAALERAALAARALDLSQAVLPSIPVTLRVKSHSDASITYSVDLTDPSCNCPDWVGSRSQLAAGSLTRCCKHVLDAFSRVRPAEGWPGWLDPFLEHGWTPHPAKRWIVIQVGRRLALTSVGGNGWVDVFFIVADGCNYERFGYNVAERRWSYTHEPLHVREIERNILQEMHGHDSTKSTGGFFRRLFG